jgi:hypothetical protein
MAKINNTEVVAFINEFVAISDNARRPMVPIWSEVLSNYLVRPDTETDLSNSTRYPYAGGEARGGRDTTYLKDPETKQVIDTLLSKLMGALFSDKFIAAKKRGREDAIAADTVTRLLDYTFDLDGHYRATQTWLLDMFLFGTGILQTTWKYDERPRTFRDIVGVDDLGEEIREEVRIANFPVYDDVRLLNIDIMDFYPDFGVDQFRDMVGCAKRVEMAGFNAMKLAKNGVYNMDAVKSAISSSEVKATGKDNDKYWRIDRPDQPTGHPGFNKFEAYEYYGEVPWRVEDGEQWRVITIANGQVLRDIPWPFDEYRVPFYDATISPIQGRLYGISPAEGARYQQDFLDFLLMMMADAVARQVKPPILYNRDAGIDPSALRSWDLDVPIGVEDVNVNQAVSTLQYSPNIPNGFALFNSVKNSLRENTGAFGSIQGGGLGVNRASATEAERTFQMALDRPEMFAKFLEKECLPPLGRSILKLYQQNLETTEELMDRIGEEPEPILADIQGNYDIQFVGSRTTMSKATKMASVDRLIQMATAIPQFANRLDWNEIGVQILEGFGFDKVAQSMSNPDTVEENLLMQQAAGPGGLSGNGNQEPQSVAPAGTPQSQDMGIAIPEG